MTNPVDSQIQLRNKHLSRVASALVMAFLGVAPSVFQLVYCGGGLVPRILRASNGLGDVLGGLGLGGSFLEGCHGR